MSRSLKHEIRIGLIVVTIVQKRRRGVSAYSFKLERLFRDGELWRRSTRLDRVDLLIASKALEMAYDWAETQSEASV